MTDDVLRILLVDDDEDDYIMTRDLLSKIEDMRVELDWVSTYDESLVSIGRDEHDIYLFDYRLGEHTGLELLRKTVAEGCKVPIILLTGQGDHEIDIDAMKAGASDYLVKDKIDANLLERSIRYAIDRKRTEEALRRERDNAQRYLDIAGVMLVIISSNKRAILINKKGCNIIGYKENEIIGKNWFDTFIPERARSEVNDCFEKLMQGEMEPIEHFENEILTKTGEEKTISWHNTILKDDQGNIIGTLSSGEDITEQKQAVEALQKSQENLLRKHEELQTLFREVETVKEEWETTMDCVEDMIILVDHEGKIKRCNNALKDFSGKSLEDILHKQWKDLIYEHNINIEKVFLRGMELFHRPSGRWFILKSYPFKRITHFGSGTVITIHDITEVKVIREKLEV